MIARAAAVLVASLACAAAFASTGSAQESCEDGPYAGLCRAAEAGLEVTPSDVLGVAADDPTGAEIPATLLADPPGAPDPIGADDLICADAIDSPYAAACRLYLAGDHESARGLVAEVAKANPGAEIPEELRPDSSLVSGFKAIWEEAAAWLVLAAALIGLVLVYRALRQPQLLLGEVTTDVEGVDTDSLKALIAAELDRAGRSSGASHERLTGDPTLNLQTIEVPEKLEWLFRNH